MKPQQRIKAAYFALGFLAFCYILARAFSVGITNDEAWTIKVFVPHPYLYIVNYSYPNANNHILNTVLIKLCFASGNHSAFAARLPNVLSFLLYACFSYRIARRYLSPLTGITCYVLLLANPFLLDFFSLARGYGLSLGFEATALYFTLAYVNDRQPADALRALLAADFAVFAGFAALNIWLALFLLIAGCAVVYPQRHGLRKTALYSGIAALALIAVIWEPLRKMRESGGFYYGGSSGFYPDTLLSLAKYSLYRPDADAAVRICLNAFLAILAAAVAISYNFRRSFFLPKTAILLILLCSVCATVAQHYLLGMLYLVDRTALVFYPLLMLCACFALNDFAGRWYAAAACLAMAGAFGINMVLHANFYKTALWYFDAHSGAVLSRLNERGQRLGRPLRINYSWPFESAFYYHLHQSPYPFIRVIERGASGDSAILAADYYIYLGHSIEKVDYNAGDEEILRYRRDTAWQYPAEHVVVFERMRK